MKLASLREGGRDGTLVVVDRALERAVRVPHVAPTLQAALDAWPEAEPRLREIAERLEHGSPDGAFAFDPRAVLSPLPRAYQWFDGGGYMPHMTLMRQARGAAMPSDWESVPLFYQGNSDRFLAPVDTYVAADEGWGIDLEGEIGVVVDDVPMGSRAADNRGRIRLLTLINDISLRNLIPAELAKGFGFFQSKPASAFSPVAVTPDELGDAWKDAKVHLPLVVHLNGKLFGKPEAGVDMTFDFGQLVAHVAKTRELEAGSIIGSGTVSNKQGDLWGSSIDHGGVGYCCLAEVRTYETIEQGKPATPFMRDGDVVRVEMFDRQGASVFGTIENRVAALRS